MLTTTEIKWNTTNALKMHINECYFKRHRSYAQRLWPEYKSHNIPPVVILCWLARENVSHTSMEEGNISRT